MWREKKEKGRSDSTARRRQYDKNMWQGKDMPVLLIPPKANYRQMELVVNKWARVSDYYKWIFRDLHFPVPSTRPITSEIIEEACRCYFNAPFYYYYFFRNIERWVLVLEDWERERSREKARVTIVDQVDMMLDQRATVIKQLVYDYR